MYSYPATNTAQIKIEPYSGSFDVVRNETANPVATTIAVAAISPQRIRLTFPSFDSCSWKNGLDTVNHDGQNPANTPLASPIKRIRIVMSSFENFN